MTPRILDAIVQDYHGGNGLALKELAAKYHLSYYVIRSALIRRGVYLPHHKIFKVDDANSSSYAWRLMRAEILLKKVVERHEGGLLPDRFLYDKINEYFKTNNDATT